MVVYHLIILLLIFLIITSIIFMVHNMYKKNGILEDIIKILYRQSSRWAVAANQDENEIIRVLHANYAAGYLWAIKDIAPTDVFKKATGEEFLEFEKKIVKIQDTATMRLASRCKEVIPISDKALIDAIYGR